MNLLFSRWLPLSFLLFAALAGSAPADDLTVLQPGDELAVFSRTLTSADKEARRVRIRVGYVLAPKVSAQLVTSPILALKAGESIDFDPKPLKERRSEVFTGAALNDRISKFAVENAGKFKTPKPQLAVQLVFVDEKGNVTDKSESAFVDFPPATVAADKNGAIKSDVTLTLGDVKAKVTIAVQRAPKK